MSNNCDKCKFCILINDFGYVCSGRSDEYNIKINKAKELNKNNDCKYYEENKL